MSTQLVGDRQLQVEEILAAFDLPVGGTLSGVAYGGRFIQTGTGTGIETADPSTGNVLGQLRSARDGVVGINSASNFPLGVPGGGWAVGGVCGDTMVWKPSSLTPLISIAAQQIYHEVTAGTDAEGVFSLVIGSGGTVGEALLSDNRVPLIQATGSCAVGERVSAAVGKRSGRAILELGGNNAVIVLDDADLKLALRAIVFGSGGTAGQRCTRTPPL